MRRPPRRGPDARPAESRTDCAVGLRTRRRIRRSRAGERGRARDGRPSRPPPRSGLRVDPDPCVGPCDGPDRRKVARSANSTARWRSISGAPRLTGGDLGASPRSRWLGARRQVRSGGVARTARFSVDRPSSIDQRSELRRRSSRCGSATPGCWRTRWEVPRSRSEARRVTRRRSEGLPHRRSRHASPSQRTESPVGDRPDRAFGRPMRGSRTVEGGSR